MVVDKDGMPHIKAVTLADGQAGLQLLDKDERRRIGAGTFADGTIILPTKDTKN